MSYNTCGKEPQLCKPLSQPSRTSLLPADTRYLMHDPRSRARVEHQRVAALQLELPEAIHGGHPHTKAREAAQAEQEDPAAVVTVVDVRRKPAVGRRVVNGREGDRCRLGNRLAGEGQRLAVQYVPHPAHHFARRCHHLRAITVAVAYEGGGGATTWLHKLQRLRCWVHALGEILPIGAVALLDKLEQPHLLGRGESAPQTVACARDNGFDQVGRLHGAR